MATYVRHATTFGSFIKTYSLGMGTFLTKVEAPQIHVYKNKYLERWSTM